MHRPGGGSRTAPAGADLRDAFNALARGERAATSEQGVCRRLPGRAPGAGDRAGARGPAADANRGGHADPVGEAPFGARVNLAYVSRSDTMSLAHDLQFAADLA